MDNMNNTKKLNKGVFILSSIAFLLALVVVYLTFLKSSPQKVFDTAIKQTFTSLYGDSNKIKDKDFLQSNIKIKTNLKSSDLEINKYLQVLNKMDLVYDTSINFKENKMNIDLGTKYNNEDLVSLFMYMTKKDGYIYLNNIFDKYVHVPIEMDEFDLEDIKIYVEEYQVIMKQLESALRNSLKKDYFKVENDNIEYNGQNIKVKKNILVLDNNNVKNIISDMLKALNNEEFIKSYSKVTKMSETEVKDYLNSYDVNEIVENNKTSYIYIYTKGIKDTFVGIKFTDNDNSVRLIKENDTYYYNIKNNSTDYSGKFDLKINNDDVSLTIYLEDKISGSITIDTVNKFDGSIKDINVNEAIEVEDLTGEDFNKIYENVMNNSNIQKFIKDNMSLFEDLSNFFGSVF